MYGRREDGMSYWQLLYADDDLSEDGSLWGSMYLYGWAADVDIDVKGVWEGWQEVSEGEGV